MKLQEVADRLDLENLTPVFDRDVTGVYISDKLSDVIANARKGNLLVIGQTNANALNAANLVELAAIVVSQGPKPDAELVARATTSQLSLFATALSRAQIAAKLYEAGLR